MTEAEMLTQRDPGEPWAAWSAFDQDSKEAKVSPIGLQDLAKYVCIESLEAMNDPILPNANAILDDGGAVGLVDQLYGQFLDWRRPYNLEPWEPLVGAAGQRIRDPEWIARDSGTCIDMSMAFAAICVRHKLRPLIAVFPPDATGVGHVAVLVLNGRPGRDVDLGLPGPVAAGVWHCRYEDIKSFIPRDLIPVDAMLATREYAAPLDASVDSLRSRLEASGRVWLVDVDYLIANEHVVPFGRPEPGSRPAIGCRLQPMPKYERLGRDAKLLNQLQSSESGVSILAGPQGVGKSRFAQYVIESSAHRCGWFLSATSDSTLMEALAYAELLEAGGAPDSLTSVDRSLYAQEALARLRRTSSGWTVVLDNAGAPDAKLVKWLPRPNPANDQRVIITTTDDHAEAWKRHGQVVPVEPISDVEVSAAVEDLSPAGLHLVDGRYVLVQALRAFRSRTHGVPADPTTVDSDSVDDPSAGPRWFWNAVRDLPDVTAEVVDAALALAVLCPTRIDRGVAEDLGIDLALGPLADLGICQTTRSGDTSIHRLFAQAVLQDLGPESARVLTIRMLGEPSVVASLQRRLEFDTLSAFVKLLADATEPTLDEAVALQALGSIQELHGHTKNSATSYERALPVLRDAGDAQRLRVANCLFGMARQVNQHEAGDAERIETALGWAVEARAIHESALADGDQGAMPAGPARCVAMIALLSVKQAKRRDKSQRREALESALADLRASESARKELLQELLENPTPETYFESWTEIARSTFNLAGPHIELAKIEEGSGIGDALGHAETVYTDVRETRVQRLGLWPGHPHLAACEHGLAIVHYYRAVLDQRAPALDRTNWLRIADGHARAAVDHRSVLDGELDGDEATKSLKLMVKISLARHALAERTGTAAQRANRDTGHLVWEAITEARDGELGPL